MTAIFVCGYECGVFEQTGGHITNAEEFSRCSISTSTVYSGLRSMRVHPTTSNAVAYMLDGIGGTMAVWAYRLNVASAPTTDVALGVTVSDPGDNGASGLGYKVSDGKYYACGDNDSSVLFGATGVTLAAGWHWVTCKANIAADPWLVDVTVDDVALGQCSYAHSPSTFGRISAGNEVHLTAYTCDYFVDDVKLSVTAGDYPLAASGGVLGKVVNADGTHTATGTNIVKGTTGTPVGAAITSATTDAFNWLNARPIGGGATDATRLINQQSNAAGEYVEVSFEQATAAPLCVEVLTVERQATTATGSFSTKLNDNGTEDAIITRSVAAGVVTDRYARKHYATMVGGGAWTLARFNALKARFGYSGDADPDQYWRGIMIEAEFAPVAAALGAKIIFRNALDV